MLLNNKCILLFEEKECYCRHMRAWPGFSAEKPLQGKSFFFKNSLQIWRPLKVMKVSRYLHINFLFTSILRWNASLKIGVLFRYNFSPEWKVTNKNCEIQEIKQHNKEYFIRLYSCKLPYEIEKDVQWFLTMENRLKELGRPERGLSISKGGGSKK